MAAPQQSNVLSFEEARRVVEDHASLLRPRGREVVDLLNSAGRVLAEPIHADRDFPPFPRAARDGYALRAEDVKNIPATLEVTGEIKAGAAPAQIPAIGPGQAVAIMTGAAVPDGADAVVMIEFTARTGDRVEVRRSVAARDNVVAVGIEARRGDSLLIPGMRLDYPALAVAASVGRSRLIVHAKPQVAVLATGDEIVDVDVLPAANQIRNSNSHSLSAQIQAAGGSAVLLPIAPDEPERLRALLAEGLESDLLLIAGGVSMGKYDLVEQVLGEMRAEFFFNGAQIQPGKPVVFGRVAVSGESSFRYFFGLPGNPVSTMVTFDLFARPMLDALAGALPRKLIFVRAKLKAAITIKTGLKRFLPAILSGEFENAEVELARWQGSGDIASVARSNCYVVVPPDRERIEAGEWVPIIPR